MIAKAGGERAESGGEQADVTSSGELLRKGVRGSSQQGREHGPNEEGHAQANT